MQKKKTVAQKKSRNKPQAKGWRPKGKRVVKDTLHGAPHEIIETKGDSKQEGNPLNKKTNPEYAKDSYLLKIDECKMWKERALASGKEIMELKDKIDVLIKAGGNVEIPADAQKLKQQHIELQEKLQPFKYECVWNNAVISMMCRPRAREVIILSA